MSSLDDLHFNLDMSLLASFLTDNMNLLMPVIVLVVAVLLALLVIDGITGSILKVLSFALGMNIHDKTGAKLSMDQLDGEEDDQQLG